MILRLREARQARLNGERLPSVELLPGVLHGGDELPELGSQGEQRVATLALVLAEAAALAERNGRSPLLLLDDVLSGLDATRRRVLGEVVWRYGQVAGPATARGGR